MQEACMTKYIDKGQLKVTSIKVILILLIYVSKTQADQKETIIMVFPYVPIAQ